MTDEQKLKLLKTIFWDYNSDALSLSKIISKDLDSIDNYELRIILIRLFERLTWYELLHILGIELIKKYLTKEIIKNLRNEYLRERYERIRRLLHQEPLPFTGWDTEYRERIKTTLLSNRWYCT